MVSFTMADSASKLLLAGGTLGISYCVWRLFRREPLGPTIMLASAGCSAVLHTAAATQLKPLLPVAGVHALCALSYVALMKTNCFDRTRELRDADVHGKMCSHCSEYVTDEPRTKHCFECGSW
jgi:hypothetical protein